MSLFATGGREDGSVPLAGVAWDGGPLLLCGRPGLLQHLGVVVHLRLVVLPQRVGMLPVLAVAVARLPVLVSSLFFPVEV